MNNDSNFDFSKFENFMDNFSSFSSNSNDYNTSYNNQEQNNNSFGNIDMSTILKMKSIMDKLNSKKNDPRSNLLLSLKPYLKNSRKQKLDQYIQLFNMSDVLESFKLNGGEGNK